MRAYSTRLAPATIDALLLAGLREQRGPVEEGAIPDVCHVRYQTLPIERMESLDRLVSRGLIRRRMVRKLNPVRPLLDPVDVAIYEATGGDQ